MYCLKCKKDTKDLNVKAFMTKNNRYMLKSTCNICKGKKSKFISKKEILGSGFLSNIFSKIPILNKIIWNICFITIENKIRIIMKMILQT